MLPLSSQGLATRNRASIEEKEEKIWPKIRSGRHIPDIFKAPFRSHPTRISSFLSTMTQKIVLTQTSLISRSSKRFSQIFRISPKISSLFSARRSKRCWRRKTNCWRTWRSQQKTELVIRKNSHKTCQSYKPSWIIQQTRFRGQTKDVTTLRSCYQKRSNRDRRKDHGTREFFEVASVVVSMAAFLWNPLCPCKIIKPTRWKASNTLN